MDTVNTNTSIPLIGEGFDALHRIISVSHFQQSIYTRNISFFNADVVRYLLHNELLAYTINQKYLWKSEASIVITTKHLKKLMNEVQTQILFPEFLLNTNTLLSANSCNIRLQELKYTIQAMLDKVKHEPIRLYFYFIEDFIKEFNKCKEQKQVIE